MYLSMSILTVQKVIYIFLGNRSEARFAAILGTFEKCSATEQGYSRSKGDKSGDRETA